MAILEISALSKRFGSKEIIRNFDLTVEGGAIFGFLGPNGAGKTTTIRLITGILKPTTGKIVIGGHDMATDPLAAKRITGYIPDAPYLYPKLSGREYMDLVADLYGVSHHQKKAADLLDRFDLLHKADDFIESYSFGMRQKLSIVAAALPSPKLIVVDEPLIGLDPPAARSVKDLFLELARDGAAIFMSTHLLDIAEALCRDVAILDRGEIVAMGRLDELLAAKNARLEEVFLRLLAERREIGSDERRRWDQLADAAASPIPPEGN